MRGGGRRTGGTQPLDAARVPRGLLVATVLPAFLVYMDTSVAPVAFPSIERDLDGASRASLSLVLSGYAIVFAAVMIPAGSLADRVGRLRMFAVGLAAFAAGSLICGLAPSVPVLIAGRVVQALGAAAIAPTSLSLLIAPIPPERHGPTFAIFATASAIAASAGPPVGGLLTELAGWRWIFLVNVPLVAIALALGRRHLRETDRRRVPLPDLLGVAALVAAVGLAMSALLGASASGGRAAVLGAAAIASAAWFVRRSLSHPRPAIDLRVFGRRHLALANLATVVVAAGAFAMFLCNALFLAAVWDLSAFEIGLAVVPGPITSAIVTRRAGRLSDRFGHAAVGVPALLAIGAGAAWFALVPGGEPAYATEWLPGNVLVGAGIGAAFPAIGTAAVSRAPAEHRATAAAVTGTARQLGGGLGISALVALLASAGGAEAAYDAGWTFAAACSVVAALLVAALPRRGGAPAAVGEQAGEPKPAAALGGAPRT